MAEILFNILKCGFSETVCIFFNTFTLVVVIVGQSDAGTCPAQLMFNSKLRTRFDPLLPHDAPSFGDLRNRVLAKKEKLSDYEHRFVKLSIGDKIMVKDYRTP